MVDSAKASSISRWVNWTIWMMSGSMMPDLPTAKTLLESIFVLALDHIYGHLRAMFFFQSKSKPVDLETLLSPLPEIETRKQFAEMLVDKAGILTTIPFEISEEESLELNDLLSKLISVQKPSCMYSKIWSSVQALQASVV